MTRQEIKSKLRGYRDAQRRLETAERELEEFEAKIENITVDYSKPRVSGSQNKDVADVIDKLRQMHERINNEWLEASRRIIEVKEIINTFDDARAVEILSRRYISCQHWETISYEMRYSREHLIRLHDDYIYKLSQKV